MIQMCFAILIRGFTGLNTRHECNNSRQFASAHSAKRQPGRIWMSTRTLKSIYGLCCSFLLGRELICQRPHVSKNAFSVQERTISETKVLEKGHRQRGGWYFPLESRRQNLCQHEILQGGPLQVGTLMHTAQAHTGDQPPRGTIGSRDTHAKEVCLSWRSVNSDVVPTEPFSSNTCLVSVLHTQSFLGNWWP